MPYVCCHVQLGHLLPSSSYLLVTHIIFTYITYITYHLNKKRKRKKKKPQMVFINLKKKKNLIDSGAD